MEVRPTIDAGALQTIANKMKLAAGRREHGQAYQRLARGLHVVYGNRDCRCRLAVGRVLPVMPSEQEIEILREVFGVPMGAGRVVRVATWCDPVEERAQQFNVIELTWTEAAVC